METQGGAGPKIAPGRPNLMIFGSIACFRRSGSRFSGQKGPRSSEMRVYIGNTGYIKNHQNFKILFCSRESKKPIFRIFPEFFRSQPGLAWPGPGVVVTREAVIGSRQPLHMVTDFPFYGFF